MTHDELNRAIAETRNGWSTSWTTCINGVNESGRTPYDYCKLWEHAGPLLEELVDDGAYFDSLPDSPGYCVDANDATIASSLSPTEAIARAWWARFGTVVYALRR